MPKVVNHKNRLARQDFSPTINSNRLPDFYLTAAKFTEIFRFSQQSVGTLWLTGLHKEQGVCIWLTIGKVVKEKDNKERHNEIVDALDIAAGWVPYCPDIQDTLKHLATAAALIQYHSYNNSAC